jgi:hypothetical protein
MCHWLCSGGIAITLTRLYHYRRGPHSTTGPPALPFHVFFISRAAFTGRGTAPFVSSLGHGEFPVFFFYRGGTGSL